MTKAESEYEVQIMKTIFIIVGGTLLACLLLTSPGMPGSPQEIQRTLENLDTTWGVAVVNGDWKTVQEILAEDFVEIDSQGRVLDKGQDIEQLKANPPLRNPTYQANEYIVRMLGADTAVMAHRATSTGEMEGKQKSETHRSLHVFIKRGGRWQALATEETQIRQ